MRIKKILLGATILTLSINTLKAEEIIPIETDIVVYESKEIPTKNSHKNRKKDRIKNRKEFEKQYGCSPEAYEELKKQKALFDQGIITIEQFEYAKSQILNKR